MHILVFMPAFDPYRASHQALTDHDDSDFAPDPRPCPCCGDDLTEESTCFRGRLVCVPCWERLVFQVRETELVRVAS